MLLSQINPLLFFNSLNSIQTFVSTNKTLDAERYLSKFATDEIDSR
ncbi:MAG: histidine kinase [Flavobacteriales bacterium]|nr:histidine kinase [Flavobacteriales bacterium]